MRPQHCLSMEQKKRKEKKRCLREAHLLSLFICFKQQIPSGSRRKCSGKIGLKVLKWKKRRLQTSQYKSRGSRENCEEKKEANETQRNKGLMARWSETGEMEVERDICGESSSVELGDSSITWPASLCVEFARSSSTCVGFPQIFQLPKTCIYHQRSFYAPKKEVVSFSLKAETQSVFCPRRKGTLKLKLWDLWVNQLTESKFFHQTGILCVDAPEFWNMTEKEGNNLETCFRWDLDQGLLTCLTLGPNFFSTKGPEAHSDVMIHVWFLSRVNSITKSNPLTVYPINYTMQWSWTAPQLTNNSLKTDLLTQK